MPKVFANDAFAIVRDLREPLQSSVVIIAAATQGVALG
jgi:hypothetical protein